MSFAVDSNAAQVADDLDGRLVDDAAERAHREAADLAVALVGPRTPRRTGRLAAGLQSVSASDGWALVDAVPYASVVDARTGFATKTLLDNETKIADLYDHQLQAGFDQT